jgi:hypothetical protein
MVFHLHSEEKIQNIRCQRVKGSHTDLIIVDQWKELHTHHPLKNSLNLKTLIT